MVFCEAQQLAWRWIWLLRDTTGNDVGLAMKLKLIHRNEEKAQLLNGITPEMIDYLSNSFAHARAAILGKYLSPDELEDVLHRQAAHGSGWLALIAEIRQQIRQGAAPDDPVVQALARRWQSLFRQSFSGEDLELEGKIRSAFQKEPDLLASVGMDAQVIAFIQQAILEPQCVNDKGCDRPDPVPKPTALSVARFRAAHQLLDDPLVFEDPLSLKILGAAEEAALRRDPLQYNTPLFKGLRTSVVVRSRMAEDEWARSKQRGIRQYVILGAGLDTFAYRNREQDGTRIFEVDLPETQQWKRCCLLAADIKEPASLTFVPINFERSTLAEALERGGFSPADAAFFSWLGVTMYLDEAAIMSTLYFIAALPAGSGVVFDYAVFPSLLSPREHRAMELLASRVAERGEPWKTYLDPTSLSRMLHSMGFSKVENLGPEQLNQRYLSGRKDGLRKSGVSRLVCARV
jgi:methyltransferase (TIGR00027 family)